MKLRYLQSAKRDIGSIIAYISDDLENPELAERTIADILRKAKRLEQFPFSGKLLEDISSDDVGYRLLVVGKYMVVYRVSEVSVDLVRIVHASLDYTRLI